jgi:hypothetical protein
MNLWQKLIEIRKLVKCLQKDTVGKVGFKDYPYISTDLILDKIMDKMNELQILLQPTILDGTEREFHYQNSKGDNKVDFVVSGKMGYMWVNAEKPEEREFINWHYYGQQDEVSKAFGSGLTYSNRYFLKMYFQIATSEDDPDQRDTSGKQSQTSKAPQQEQQGEVISPSQAKRIYALSNGNAEICKTVLKTFGYTKSDEVQKKHYDAICKAVQEVAADHNN